MNDIIARFSFYIILFLCYNEWMGRDKPMCQLSSFERGWQYDRLRISYANINDNQRCIHHSWIFPEKIAFRHFCLRKKELDITSSSFFLTNSQKRADGPNISFLFLFVFIILHKKNKFNAQPVFYLLVWRNVIAPGTFSLSRKEKVPQKKTLGLVHC